MIEHLFDPSGGSNPIETFLEPRLINERHIFPDFNYSIGTFNFKERTDSELFLVSKNKSTLMFNVVLALFR